jgi:glycosyltransferase involved in cell wall biosynthesis
MLKVLCFGRFFDDIPGGMQTHVEHLFESLKGEVQFVHLVPSRDAHSSFAQVRGFPLVRTASWNVDGSLALSPKLILEARRLHAQHKFDLVHLHFPDPMSHLASMALPAGIPRVITWHADITRQKLMKYVYLPLQRRALEKAARVIVPTPAHISSSAYLPELPTGKVSVVPFGFDLEDYAKPHELTAQLQAQYGSQMIWALGRHVYYKGFDHLIDAMAHLPPETQLVIGGDGPFTEQWKARAAASPAAQRIHFVGFVKQEQVAAYFQSCRVFCLPAINQAEAFGIVQVEAMACGKPVVSTRLNNGVDFVNQDGYSGLTVPVADVPALAQALHRLLSNDTLYQRLGQQALKRAQEEFSLPALREKTLAVYRQAVAGQTLLGTH